MEIISILLIMYAIKCGIEDARKGWRSSKSAYTASADRRFPNAPKSRRVARALNHDIGYWSAQVFRGFPVARRGFATGWQAGRQVQAQGKAGGQAKSLWRPVPGAVDSPAPAQPKRDGGEGRTFPVLLTARSKSGRKLNPFTGEPFDRITVYDPADLQRRLTAAAADSDMQVTVEPLPPLGLVPAAAREPENETDPHANCNAPGCGCTCHGTAKAPAAVTEQEPSQETVTQFTTEGTPVMAAVAAAGDITYSQHVDILTGIRDEAEQEMQSVSRQRMMNHLDTLMGLKLDSQSLAEAAAIDDALKAQEEAAKETFEAADTARTGLQKRHGGIQDAVDSSPVHVPAEPEYYAS